MSETSTLKTLIVHDSDKGHYTISNHNLEAEKASAYVTEWQPQLRDGCRFITLDQKQPHTTPDAQNCRACRDQVRKSPVLQPPPKFKRRDA